MICTYLRSSSIGSYRMCPQQYLLNYVLGVPDQSGKAAEMGTITHRVAEILAISSTCKKKSFTVDGIGRIKVSQCEPHWLVDKCYKYYTEKSPHKYVRGDLKKSHLWIDKLLEYNNGEYDPRNRNILEIEKFFDIEIDEDWANFRYEVDGEIVTGKLHLKGTIDLIDLVECGGSTVLSVVDYKTGKRKDWATDEVKDYDKLRKDHQLRLYHYALSKIYPEHENVFVNIFFVNDGGVFTIPFSKDDLPETEKMLKEYFLKIRRTNIPKLNRGWKCRTFCTYGKTNFQNSHIEAQVETRPIPKKQGDLRTCCEQVAYDIDLMGMDNVIEKYTYPDHNADNYQNPGE